MSIPKHQNDVLRWLKLMLLGDGERKSNEKKKKTEKSKTEKIAKALRKAGYGIMELKRNPDLVVNYSDTFTLTIFEAPKSC